LVEASEARMCIPQDLNAPRITHRFTASGNRALAN
jgi:hypothetical protein